MGFFEKIFDLMSQGSGEEGDHPSYFTLNYEYENESYGDDGWKKYRINIKVEFTWDENKGIYEVNSYASSPDGFSDVEIPDYKQFENDVNYDLQNKNINPIYIPDIDEWNFY